MRDLFQTFFTPLLTNLQSQFKLKRQMKVKNLSIHKLNTKRSEKCD